MRTEVGTIKSILPNGLVLIQASRTSLFSRHASSIGNSTAPIEVRNDIGAQVGDYVEFAMPDQGMALGGFLGFGVPMIIVLVCITVFYANGPSWGMSEGGAAAGGFVGGLIVSFIVMKIFGKAWRGHRAGARIIRIIE